MSREIVLGLFADADREMADLTALAAGQGKRIMCGEGCASCCHEQGTLMLDPDTDSWMRVEDHPTARPRRERGFEVRLWGLPFSETVTSDHRYWGYRWEIQDRTRQRPRPETVTAPDCLYTRDLDTSSWIGEPIDCRVETEAVPDWLRDPEWWWLIGLWWGDGWLRQARGEVLFTVARKDTVTLSRLTGILDAREIAWTSIPQGDGGCTRVWFRHPRLAAYLDRWYLAGRSQKCPPREVERLPVDWQAELAHGYIAADGHIDGIRVAVTSVSLSGLLTFRRLLARLGVAASIAETGRRAGPMRIMGRDCTVQDTYLLHFTEGAELLGYALRQADRRRLTRSVIQAGHRWTRVRSVRPTDDVRTFIAVTTSTEDYFTHFGRSHNCAYVVGTIKAEAEVIADFVQAMPKAKRDETIGRLFAWERAWRLFAGKDTMGANLKVSTAWQAKGVACPMLDLKTNRCGIYPVRPISCFHPNTWIYTENGARRIREILAGDRVYGMDGHLHRVTATMSRVHEGELLANRSSGTHTPAWCIPDHRWYTARQIDKRRRPSPDRAAAETLTTKRHSQEGSYLTMPARFEDRAPLVRLDVMEYVAGQRDDDRLLPFAHGGAMLAGREQQAIPVEIAVGDDFLFMLGLYLAEGSATAAGATFTMHADERWVLERVAAYLARLGIRHQFWSERNKIDLKVASCLFGRLMIALGGRLAAGKAIVPSLYGRLSHAQRWAVFEGWYAGDGRKQGKARSATTKSETLVQQMKLAALAYGHLPKIYVTNRPDREAPTYDLTIFPERLTEAGPDDGRSEYERAK